MHCRKCQKELPEGALFCCWCGVPQLRQRREKTDIAVPKPTRMASGEWRIQLRLDGQSTVIKAETERECIAKAKAAKLGILEIKRSPEKITLTKAIDRYIEDKSAVLSPSTIRGYRTIQKNYFQSLLPLQVGSITQQIAQKAVNDETKKHATKTVYNAWSFIRTVIQSVTGESLSVTTAQVVSDEALWLTPEQITVFCKAIKGTPIEIGALLALSSLRRSEIFALKWENVDLEKRELYVRGAKVYDEHHKLIEKKQNKNKSSRRAVPIMMDQLYNALFAQTNKTGYVFSGFQNDLYNHVNKICEANGLPLVGVHGLRHSFASLAASLGIPEAITMEIGGWSDPRTLRKIYTHIAKSSVQNSQSKMAVFYNE